MEDMGIILDGLKLLLAGMGAVFAFLALMILWIVLAAKVTARFAHLLPDSPVPVQAKNQIPAGSQGDDGENDNILVAISAAIHRYRSERSRRG